LGKAVSRAGPPPAGAAEQLVALFNADRHAELETKAGQLTRKHPAFGLAWKMLGAARQMQGKDPFAALQKAAGLLPDDLELHYNLALSLHGAGRLDDAARSYGQVLQLQPAMVEAHYSLGIILQALQQPDAAQASLRRALELRPDFAEAHNFLGGVLQSMGRLGEAAISFRRTLEIRPEFAGAWSNLGTVLLAQGQGDESLACYRRGLAIDPAYADVHFNLGNALRSQGQPQQAVLAYQRALELKPDVAAVLNNLGDVLRDMGRFDEAAASCRRALEIRPDYLGAWSNLGNAQLSLGLAAEAIDSYRAALKIDPGHAGVLSNLGNALAYLGRHKDAVASYGRALAIDPSSAPAWLNMGESQRNLQQYDEAQASCRRALAIKPDYAEAHNNLGNVLMEMGDIDEALASLRRAIELKPDYQEAYDNMLFALNYHADKSAEEIVAAYREYDERLCRAQRSSWRPHGNSRNLERRLKVGYVSPDFRHHSARHFLEPLLANHDRDRVEVFAYAELAQEDDVSRRYRACVEHWTNTQGLSDEVLARRIRADGIDILVDLAGHTYKTRLQVFAYKPAPVSVTWLGYGCTSGLSAIDYLLTDHASAPPGSEHLYAERPWRLTTPQYAYRPAPDMGEPGPLPALERGHDSFGTLTRAVRINHRTITVWSAILKQVKGARLVINSGNYRDPAIQERLAQRFLAHGIERERLEIGYQSPPWDVLRGIDVGLDCFPHNSGTTLFESLYMGVPFVSLAGRPSVGRLGSTILEGLGHPEWIAASEQDYVDRAVALAADLPELARLRAGLRAEMEGSPLMDEAGFARKLEAAYREMFALWCSGRD
jgi:predicted O-linked N-acetylglucosamine transferase (SPINDLY family)